MEEAVGGLNRMNKLLDWHPPEHALEDNFLRSPYQDYLKGSYPSILSNLDRSKIIKVEKLGTTSYMAKRVKIIGAVDEHGERKIDLQALFPMAEEL